MKKSQKRVCKSLPTEAPVEEPEVDMPAEDAEVDVPDALTHSQAANEKLS